jgi:hypothetical protein
VSSLEEALKYGSLVLVFAVILANWQINQQIDTAMVGVEVLLDDTPYA